jgi:hypothetical protein
MIYELLYHLSIYEKEESVCRNQVILSTIADRELFNLVPSAAFQNFSTSFIKDVF